MKQDRRGQTTLDFAIGISVFLVSLLFIFQFVPGIIAPFDQSTQEDTVATNRIADQISTGVLASPSKPYVLDTHCTVRFFDGDAPSECSYESGALDEQFDVGVSFQNVNVTIKGNATTTPTIASEQLCWSNTDGQLVEAGNTNCDVPLRRGDSPPKDNSVSVTARRVVLLDGHDVTLFVVVW